MKRLLILPLAFAAALAGAATSRIQDQCGPFTDVSPLYCPYVLEAYYTGITAGTSPTTFSPDLPITRAQSAVFTTKALNQALARGSRRAALGQWWTTTPHWDLGLGVTPVGTAPLGCACDGRDVWVANSDFPNQQNGSVSRVRASDGRVLETWTGITEAFGIAVAAGRVFVTDTDADSLFVIDPSQPAGPATLLRSNLHYFPGSIVFDGSKLWIASTFKVFLVDPSSGGDLGTVGFQAASGLVFDGTHVWVTDATAGTLTGLNVDGTFFTVVPLGGQPAAPVFDGSNVWVPNYAANSVSVVRAATGELVATLTGNGIASPNGAVFDGQRVLVSSGVSDGLSLWRAADLTPISFVGVPGSHPAPGCSDGIQFWVPLSGINQLARF